MRQWWDYRRVIAALSLALGACGDTSGPIRNVTFTPCGATPTFFAFQGKDGPWTSVSSQGGSFSFRLPQELISVVFLQGAGGGGSVAFFYSMTTEEFIELVAQPCDVASVTELSGTVAAVPDGNTVQVTVGNGTTVVNPATSTAFQLSHTTAGLVDVVAATQTTVSGQTQANRIIIRRGQTLPTGSVIGTLSFAGTEAKDVTNGTVTIAGVNAGESATVTEQYYTVGRATHSLVLATGVGNGARANVRVPDDLSSVGDFYIHSLNTTAANSVRTTTRYDDAPGDRSLTLGPELATPTFTTLSTTPFTRIRVTLAAQSEYESFAFARLKQSAPPSAGGGDILEANIIVTAGFLGATPVTWTLDIPDVSQVPGYPAGADFVLPSEISWVVSALQGPVAAFFGNDRIPSGAVFSVATRTGSVFVQ